MKIEIEDETIKAGIGIVSLAAIIIIAIFMFRGCEEKRQVLEYQHLEQELKAKSK